MDRDKRKGDSEGDRDGEYEGDAMKSPGRLAGPGRRKPKFVVEVGQSGPDNEQRYVFTRST